MSEVKIFFLESLHNILNSISLLTYPITVNEQALIFQHTFQQLRRALLRLDLLDHVTETQSTSPALQQGSNLLRTRV